MKQAAALWNQAESDEFVDYISRHPLAGDIIPDTGGVRKVRRRRQGKGKRGGVRIIYFFYDRETPLLLLMVYAKSERENISADDKAQVGAVAALIKKRLWQKGSMR